MLLSLTTCKLLHASYFCHKNNMLVLLLSDRHKTPKSSFFAQHGGARKFFPKQGSQTPLIGSKSYRLNAILNQPKKNLGAPPQKNFFWRILRFLIKNGLCVPSALLSVLSPLLNGTLRCLFVNRLNDTKTLQPCFYILSLLIAILVTSYCDPYFVVSFKHSNFLFRGAAHRLGCADPGLSTLRILRTLRVSLPPLLLKFHVIWGPFWVLFSR